MYKIMTIVGTRPELIKMSRVIDALDKSTNHILVHTGQNSDYELNQIFFDELKIRKPDYFLEAAGETAAQTIANIIEKSDKVFELEKPDALLLYGDTNSCLAVISAKRKKIPIFHMEAGNRCFDQRVPEELNRKVVDHLSDINMVLTEHARSYLIREGIPPERIIKTGSHMQEVLEHFRPEIDKSNILSHLELEKGKYFLVSAHREENVDIVENLQGLLDSLNKLVEKYKFPIIVSTHPRTQRRLKELGATKEALSDKIQFLKPFGFFDYVQLQLSAFCILSDSGTITEEASLLHLPAITIRDAHERPEGMDEGILIMSTLKPHRILTAVDTVIKRHNKDTNIKRTVLDYQAGMVSQKVLYIVLSYIDYVNRVVWTK